MAPGAALPLVTSSRCETATWPSRVGSLRLFAHQQAADTLRHARKLVPFLHQLKRRHALHVCEGLFSNILNWTTCEHHPMASIRSNHLRNIHHTALSNVVILRTPLVCLVSLTDIHNKVKIIPPITIRLQMCHRTLKKTHFWALLLVALVALVNVSTVQVNCNYPWNFTNIVYFFGQIHGVPCPEDQHVVILRHVSFLKIRSQISPTQGNIQIG
mmetsp:Transcript_43954/g.116165  ORF Transcript_43954/g.116165 Transcript_43954/m.116165 type:complete len:214 (+) Transcript_43954:165-806(+)